MPTIDDLTQHANTAYIRASMKAPVLSRETEHELALAWRERQDEKALHELIRAYARLAVAMASKFRHYGLPLGDLIQEANVGLMQAAARFEPERDVRFSTYAMWWIKASIQDYVLRNWSIVRTGTTSAHKSLFFNLRRLKAKIVNLTGSEHLSEEGRATIARDLGVSLEDVRLMEGRLSPDQSMSAPVASESDDEWGDFLQDDRPNPEEIVIGMKDAKTRSEWLNSALARLPEREQNIIRARHLTDGNLTLEDLGKKLGISKERVRQLEARAMGRLRELLAPRAMAEGVL
jgi:RNA polymerase sigma-32 factor